MTQSKKLIYNAIQIPDGRVLVSRHRHDYQTLTDTTNGKTYMVDGGLDYCRRSNHGDEVDLCLYNDEPHSVQRDILRWGTYGKDGKSPLKLVPISEMETEHIMAVLKECAPAHVLRECMIKELETREKG